MFWNVEGVEPGHQIHQRAAEMNSRAGACGGELHLALVGFANTSLGPPAANGLIMVTGRVGQSSAPATAVKANEATARIAVTARHMVSSELPYVFAQRPPRFLCIASVSNADSR
jgi:hypothetical protein